MYCWVLCLPTILCVSFAKIVSFLYLGLETIVFKLQVLSLILQFPHLPCLFLPLLHILTPMQELVLRRLNHRIARHCSCVRRIKCQEGNRRSYWCRRVIRKPLKPSSCTLSMRLFVRFPQMAPIVNTWFVCPPGHQWRDINLQKMGLGGSVLTASPVLKLAKGW